MIIYSCGLPYNKKIVIKTKFDINQLLLTDLGMGLILLILIASAVFSVVMVISTYSHLTKPNIPVSQSQTVTGAVLITNFGRIEIQLDDFSPAARENFVKLVRENFYSGLRFHRIVAGLGIQTGDPQSRDLTLVSRWGTGGPGYTLIRRASQSDSMSRGVVIIANEGEADSGSQFMILTADSPWLAGHNTILAHVTAGIEVADTISRLSVGVTGIPAQDVILQEIKLQ